MPGTPASSSRLPPRLLAPPTLLARHEPDSVADVALAPPGGPRPARPHNTAGARQALARGCRGHRSRSGAIVRRHVGPSGRAHAAAAAAGAGAGRRRLELFAHGVVGEHGGIGVGAAGCAARPEHRPGPSWTRPALLGAGTDAPRRAAARRPRHRQRGPAARRRAGRGLHHRGGRPLVGGGVARHRMAGLGLAAGVGADALSGEATHCSQRRCAVPAVGGAGGGGGGAAARAARRAARRRAAGTACWPLQRQGRAGGDAHVAGGAARGGKRRALCLCLLCLGEQNGGRRPRVRDRRLRASPSSGAKSGQGLPASCLRSDRAAGLVPPALGARAPPALGARAPSAPRAARGMAPARRRRADRPHHIQSASPGRARWRAASCAESTRRSRSRRRRR